jgi:hypothetical protein
VLDKLKEKNCNKITFSQQVKTKVLLLKAGFDFV